VYFDGSSEASLYCILRDLCEKLRIVVVSQITLKTLVPAPALYTSSFGRKCKIVLLSRRSTGPPLARGPIRRNQSNRLQTGPGCTI